MNKITKVVILLCEGKTDVAFLSRLLITSDNYKNYKKTVESMPFPFGLNTKSKTDGYFSKKLKEYEYDSAQLHEKPLLPTILDRNRGNSYTLILLYSMGGMGKISNYKEIIRDFSTLTKGIQLNSNSIHASLGFIYDYDNSSLLDRVEYIKNQFQDQINELQNLSDTIHITDSKFFKKIGYYILPKSLSKGNLEDIIIPIIESRHNLLVEKAKAFLIERGFKRMKISDNTQEDENKTKSDLNKSIIGVLGQIEHSGFGNAEIIQRSSLLNHDEMKKSNECKGILAFIKSLRDPL